ncbi:MAG: polynucleotide kinase-phosphatase [Parachlamydia sp.]|nr:MAG: polynucleotide kinase-phosphatase [Parachlamydia sp.]
MEQKIIKIPELSLILLVGISGSGKSTFAQKHFKPTEVISSDYCRALVADDPNDQSATKDAFDVLTYIASKRLAAGKLTVIDATNIQSASRKNLLNLARHFHCIPVAIVINTAEKLCIERNKKRADRSFGDHVIKQQSNQLKSSLQFLKKEGFRDVYRLDTLEESDSAVIHRVKLWNDLKHEHGPFDIIGDIHGCFDELSELLKTLGYIIHYDNKYRVSHPHGRKVIFLGDLVDRGPNTPAVLKLVMDMTEAGIAFCVPGNHDIKLMRKLKGQDVKVAHGMQDSLEQLEQESENFIQRVIDFIDGLVSHYVLDDGKLVVAHAGMKEGYQGRGSKTVREFALFGETTGETDEYGLPVRYAWANEYRGKAIVVYGHTPVPTSDWLNNTINIDSGCVFGGKLTALRYPEKELISVVSKQVYAKPVKPLLVEVTDPKVRSGNDILSLSDVLGKKIVSTRLHNNVTILEENSITALEVMSRFAINPKLLIYLPPTMSPTETSDDPKYLEHPNDSFRFFRKNRISKVICQEKHMGSRAIVIICKDTNVVKTRFGVDEDRIGICYTRTGRNFFTDTQIESQFFNKVHKAVEKADLWAKLNTDWICLDCELMPWSAKAQELIKEQYASVGVAAQSSLSMTVELLEKALKKNPDVADLYSKFTSKLEMVNDYIRSYERYCWPIVSIEDYKLAPFHILASEGNVHVEKDHGWHMDVISHLVAADSSLFKKTQSKIVHIEDTQSCEKAVNWWVQLTEQQGGEGFVIKPYDFTVVGPHGLIQPGLKCRGREYLRIIYGPEYTIQENLDRVKVRNVAKKRSLALREYALGIEALERFVKREPLYKCHEAVFGVLALESEPIDPRL